MRLGGTRQSLAGCVLTRRDEFLRAAVGGSRTVEGSVPISFVLVHSSKASSSKQPVRPLCKDLKFVIRPRESASSECCSTEAEQVYGEPLFHSEGLSETFKGWSSISPRQGPTSFRL